MINWSSSSVQKVFMCVVVVKCSVCSFSYKLKFWFQNLAEQFVVVFSVVSAEVSKIVTFFVGLSLAAATVEKLGDAGITL